MTNSPTSLDAARLPDFNWLTDLGPMGLLFVSMLTICYFVRRLAFIPNLWMLPTPLLGAVLYVAMPKAVPADLISKCLVGVVVSIFAVVSAFAAHDNLFVWLAKFVPALSVFVSPEVLENKSKPTTPNP